MFMPFNILGIWLRGLLTVALLAGGICLLVLWFNHRETVVTEAAVVAGERESPAQGQPPPLDGQQPIEIETARVHVVPWQFGLNRETAFLVGGLGLLGWSLGGGWLFTPRLLRRAGNDEPTAAKSGNAQRLRLPDGSHLQVRSFGPADADPLVLTHGWGQDCGEWYYTIRELARGHRVIVWDLPGLGESERPVDRDWDLVKLARNLDQVVATAGGKPVVLVGHSIGAMIALTYCKIFPEAVGNRVRGLVLAHGTYTNPVRTTSMAGLYTALQKPILEPLCYLMVWLSPVFRVLNWLNYLRGSAHRSTERESFSGKETRGQLDFVTSYICTAAPDVVGRGMLAMFRYDATEALAGIGVPTLVVTGDRDSTCLPEASRYMAETIPVATLVTLRGVKHCGHFEQHAEFHSAANAFLASLAIQNSPADEVVLAGSRTLPHG